MRKAMSADFGSELRAKVPAKRKTKSKSKSFKPQKSVNLPATSFRRH
jgi:hypothetical protein